MKKSTKKLITKLLLSLFILLILSFIENELSNSSHANVNNNIKEITNGNLEIYYFDVGQADSILIKENDKSMLIDAGNNEDGDYLVDYIKNDIGLEKINIVVGTHPHEDHIGGLDNIINSFDIEKIYLPNVITTTKTFNDVLESIKNKHYKITIPKINEKFNLDNMYFKVLFSGSDEKNLNDSSIVLKLDYGSTSYLFTGDISSNVEKIIINSDIDVDVLKVAHHGSSYSSSDDFLDRVSPLYAIILVGNDNIYNHPSINNIKKFNDRGIKIYRTDKDGTIKLISDGNNINIETIKTNING